MDAFKKFLMYFRVGCFLVILTSCLVTYFSYQEVKDAIERQFPELIRLVAEDNCLDNTVNYNGQTIYQSYRNKLQKVDELNELLEFRTDCIEVKYNEENCYDRSKAPQKGSELQVKLTGYYVATFPLFQLPIDIPIQYSDPVIGIRYYRDRE